MNEPSLRLLLFVLALILVIISITFSWISADAPYYLSVAKDVSNGLIPYKDIYNNYTPLVMYFYSVPFKISNQTPYVLFLLFQYLIIATNAFLLYKIIIKTTNLENIVVQIVALCFFIATISSDGNYIALEPWVVLFVLLGVYSFYTANGVGFILSGILFSLAFLCKQYGVLPFIPFVLLLLIQKRFKEWFLLCLGALIPLGLFIFYFTSVENVSFTSLLTQVSGRNYAESSASFRFSIIKYLIGGKVFMMYFFLSLLTFSLYKYSRSLVRWELVTALVFSLMPTLVRNYQHYFILGLPFVFILFALQLPKEKTNAFLYILFMITIFCSVFLIVRISKYYGVKSEQIELANQIEDKITKNSNVLIKDYRFLYLLNNYKNPLLNSLGYNYLVPNDTILKSSFGTNYFIIDSRRPKLSQYDSLIANEEIIYYYHLK